MWSGLSGRESVPYTRHPSSLSLSMFVLVRCMHVDFTLAFWLYDPLYVSAGVFFDCFDRASPLTVSFSALHVGVSDGRGIFGI